MATRLQIGGTARSLWEWGTSSAHARRRAATPSVWFRVTTADTMLVAKRSSDKKSNIFANGLTIVRDFLSKQIYVEIQYLGKIIPKKNGIVPFLPSNLPFFVPQFRKASLAKSVMMYDLSYLSVWPDFLLSPTIRFTSSVITASSIHRHSLPCPSPPLF